MGGKVARGVEGSSESRRAVHAGVISCERHAGGNAKEHRDDHEQGEEHGELKMLWMVRKQETTIMLVDMTMKVAWPRALGPFSAALPPPTFRTHPAATVTSPALKTSTPLPYWIPLQHTLLSTNLCRTR